MLLTLDVMEFRIQCQTYLGGADALQFILICLCAAEFADDFTENVVLCWAEVVDVRSDKLVNGKYVDKFDVDCRFCSGV